MFARRNYATTIFTVLMMMMIILSQRASPSVAGERVGSAHILPQALVYVHINSSQIEQCVLMDEMKAGAEELQENED